MEESIWVVLKPEGFFSTIVEKGKEQKTVCYS